MNRLETLTAHRAKTRQLSASGVAAHIIEDARAQGIEIRLIGSLAHGDFRLHSDIDLLVRGAIDPARRSLVERLVARHMRETDIPYDLIFEDDLTPDRVEEFLNDIL